LLDWEAHAMIYVVDSIVAGYYASSYMNEVAPKFRSPSIQDKIFPCDDRHSYKY